MLNKNVLDRKYKALKEAGDAFSFICILPMGKFVYSTVPAKTHANYTSCADKRCRALASCDLRASGWAGSFIFVSFLLKWSKAFRTLGDRD